jgi:hypothetical protein
MVEGEMVEGEMAQAEPVLSFGVVCSFCMVPGV